MNILFVGDIFGHAGRRMVSQHLGEIVQAFAIDLAIANAENAAGGFGITPAIADELLGMGLDVLTSGNHVWDKREIYDYLAREPRLLRPANYVSDLPGQGLLVVRAHNGVHCAVMNLQGRTYMPNTDCPFRKADRLIESMDPAVKVRLVDFHAEVTSEKMAMGWHLNGRVSALVGTHTHIATADTRILSGGTAYQTDAGMTGPYDSIIGVDKQTGLRRFLTGLPIRMDAARGGPELHSVVVEVDEHTGRARSIRRHMIRGD
jgi:2',3'-cyclic-nucleotide 2'-phosphodiesterase